MLTALDHVIIGTNNLEQAAIDFNERLGLAPSGGGIHPSGGTANRIIVIGDTYLELITVRTPSEAQQGIRERLAQGDGYLNFVLASDDIEADSAAMRNRGVKVIGPTPGQLTSADKRSRGWSRTDVERAELAQHYPFLIQHDSTGEERRFRLAGWQQLPEHPLGAVKILSTTIAVTDLKEATQRYQQIYGLQPSETFTGDVDAWEAMLVAFPLSQSGQSFELAEPLPLATNPPVGNQQLPEPGALSRHLQTFGESLCRMTLAVKSLSVARRYLDEHEVIYTFKDAPHHVLWIHPDQANGATIALHEQVS